MDITHLWCQNHSWLRVETGPVLGLVVAGQFLDVFGWGMNCIEPRIDGVRLSSAQGPALRWYGRPARHAGGSGGRRIAHNEADASI
jgi:hypothetical protein